MAKTLRQVAPGYADVTPTADWCEFIAYEQRQNAGSERSVIYGSACGRWCSPVDAKYMMVDMWGAGGNSWGSCCCMSGAPAGGGAAQRLCLATQPGEVFCYVVGHGGCCQPSSVQEGCFSLMRMTSNCCTACVKGGWCGISSCYYDYCCSFDGSNRCKRNWDDSAVPVTSFKYNCSCCWTWNSACGCTTRIEFGRQPSMRAHTMKGGWNCVPCGGMCHEMPTTASTKDLGDCCSAAAECMKGRVIPVGRFPIGHSAVDLCQNAQYATCGEIAVATSGSNRRVSGHRMVNLTSVNADGWGGWNWSRWHLCHNGSNNHSCWTNIRTVGFGGHPARVCGGPCCCGSWGGHGSIIWKYRGSKGTTKPNTNGTTK